MSIHPNDGFFLCLFPSTTAVQDLHGILSFTEVRLKLSNAAFLHGLLIVPVKSAVFECSPFDAEARPSHDDKIVVKLPRDGLHASALEPSKCVPAISALSVSFRRRRIIVVTCIRRDHMLAIFQQCDVVLALAQFTLVQRARGPSADQLDLVRGVEHERVRAFLAAMVTPHADSPRKRVIRHDRRDVLHFAPHPKLEHRHRVRPARPRR
eukprot:CAMPEP_0185841600 /NCGR_PEP_ID=MMETSP1353-20130828/17979_1 /TAXON_ID=1077150 /ORGANISM="Erythrolobus australicus, Strain CCMP3124" /LENGTH=208 /DNA_ID=CAMNT_0028541081 /DNA_START=171 /DNA_END=794 /DNA_ORIENTATION=-